MSTLIHADIFFFVTTVVVVLIGASLIVAIIYLIRVLRDLRYVAKVVRDQTDLLASDLEQVRATAKNQGIFGSIVNLVAQIFNSNRKRSATQSKNHKKNGKNGS